MLESVRHHIEKGELEEARSALLDTLLSPQCLIEWRNVLREDDPTFVPRVLQSVQDVRFSAEAKTAEIDLSSRVMLISPAFYQEAVTSYNDLLFILMHERNHVLLDLVYGSRFSDFKSKDFWNFWEDVYINNVILSLARLGGFLRRVFDDEEDNPLKLLAIQRCQEWFILNDAFLKDNLSSGPYFTLSLLRDSQLFSQVVSYPEWMDAGLELEPMYEEENITSVFAALAPGSLKEVRRDEKTEGLSSALRSFYEPQMMDKKDLPSRKDATRGDSLLGFPAPSLVDIPSYLRDFLSSFSDEALPDEVVDIVTRIRFESDLVDFVSGEVVGKLVGDRNSSDVTFPGKRPVPRSLSRSDIVMVSSGYYPVLWEDELRFDPPELTVYLDVSGSMEEYHCIVSILDRFLSGICSRYYQFSDVVVEVSPREKFIYSTGGTRYDEVANHILRHSFRSVVVLTDSTDSLAPQNVEALSQQLDNLYLFEVSPGAAAGGFDLIATRVITMNTGDRDA